MMVKKWLSLKNVSYDEINTDEKPELLPYIMEISGAATMPVIVVEGEHEQKSISIGYKPGQLAAMVGA